MRILIVDDHDENNYLLRSLLEGNNHHVQEASNGKDALDKLKSSAYDLIISDILMPIMDGFTLCREVRKNPQLKHIPFITYTATYTGYKDEELAYEVGADLFIVKPCEPEELIQHVNAIFETAKTRTAEPVFTDRSESEILKLYNERLVRKLEQKMLEAEKEVEERLRVISALERSEALLKTTQRISKIGGWEWDVATRNMYWTEELYRLHDALPDSEMNGDDLINLSLSCYPETERAQIRQYFDTCCQTGEPYVFESWFTTLNGRKLYIKTSAKAEIVNGSVIKVYGDFHDITVSKLAEIEREQLREQLRQVQKLDSIGQLAGGVAHDFNNILTVILGYAREIADSLHPESPMMSDVEEIVKAGRRAITLTRQLLTFSRKQVTQLQTINLNTVINDLQKMLFRLIGEDIQVELNLDQNLAMVNADIGQMEQVIINLSINARESMPSGGKLILSTSNVQVKAKPHPAFPDIKSGDYIMLTVADNGCGMNTATMSRIFEPFFTTKGNQSGTGLGLATVYGIVRQSGGYISVDSELEKGTSFSIYLPVADSVINADSKVPETEIVKGLGGEIMVVEDDEFIRNLATKILSRIGYNVSTFESGTQALKYLQASKLLPDLIITDVVMPGISGIEFASKISEEYPSIKVILMSGYSEDVIQKHGVINTGHPFLQKPFSNIELADMVKRTLQN
jgi:signal transduction histidine kinase/DNA-binding response OmpR family regulator